MKALARLRRRREAQLQKPVADVTPPLTPSPLPSCTTPITAPTTRTTSSPSASSTPAVSLTDPFHPTHDTDDTNPPAATSPAPASTPHQVAVVDGKGQLTFNLQLFTDAGIVLCPGFHREQQTFTSSALLAAARPPPQSPQSQAAALPALPAKADVEEVYSPTLLPLPPSLRSGEDSNGTGSVPASSTAPLDELHVSFAKGAFSLIDTPVAAAAQSSAALSSSTPPPQSTTAAATAALKRLALTPWRSANVVTAAPGSDSDTAAFPPTSALPPVVQQAEEASNGLDDEEDAMSGLHDSSAPPATPSPSSATTTVASETAPTKSATVQQPGPGPSVPSSSTDVSPQAAVVSSFPPASAVSSTTTSSTADSPTSTVTATPTSSSSCSRFSLPAALFSTVSSWLFPPTPSTQAPADTTTASPPTAPTPPPAPLPPPPPPPYASTLRHIVIIGIHGWSLFGGMLGDKPQLVSSRFCYYIQHALQRYLRTLPSTAAGVRVTCVPLYGHGRVEERVAMYVGEQLPQYADELATADHIIIACHSQGCMVTSSLLALLLLTPNPPLALPSPPHISILMLAGLHHGPFPDLPTDLYPPTKELLSYSHFHTTHSQLHIERMHRLLAAGVRVMLVGSVHDAVVPLYSSLGQLLGRSPNLLRAMYVDYSHYQPDFLYSLLSLTLYLANRPPALPAQQQPAGWVVGGSDVLVHLSGFLRGSLLEKAGGAHSAMHRLVDVYGLGVEWAMGGAGEVAGGGGGVGGVDGWVGGGGVGGYSGVMWSSHLTDGFTLGKLNRHLLVWSVRGMLMELEGRRGEKGLDVDEEKQRLNALFADWAPKTKNLRALRETLVVVFDSNRTASIQSNL